MRKKLWILATALVSVLGLASCSPDNSEDGWRLHEPRILDPNQSSKPISISAALLERPSAGAELVFEEADLADGTLEVSSSCRSHESRTDDHQIFRSVHRIPLGSLWPSEMWKKLGPSELEATLCTFSFVARNSVGSTHSFKISGLRLRDFETLDAAVAKRARGEAWSLLCDGFTSETTDEDDNALRDEPVSVHHMALRASTQTRPLGHQKCRLLSKKNEASGLKRFALSRGFDLDFPNPRAVASSASNFGVLGTSRAREAIYSIDLSNPSEVPIAYRIATPSHLALQPLMRMNGWEHLAQSDRPFIALNVLREPLTTTISGEKDHWSQDGFETIVIGPRSKVTVSLSFSAPLRCLRGEPETQRPQTFGAQPPEGMLAELTGFYFGFSSPITLESIDFWSQSKPRDMSESYSAVPLDLPLARTAPLLSAFQGIPEYSKRYDSSGIAPNESRVRVDSTMLTRWCLGR